MAENIGELKFLINECNNTFKLILKKIEDDEKYVFKEECTDLLNNYFIIADKIEKMKNKCKHCEIKIKSHNDEIYYECSNCEQIF